MYACKYIHTCMYIYSCPCPIHACVLYFLNLSCQHVGVLSCLRHMSVSVLCKIIIGLLNMTNSISPEVHAK